MSFYPWHRYASAESLQRITDQHEEPWVAIGDFLDDWRRSAKEDRAELVHEPLEETTTLEFQHWAAFFAATVEQLCTQDGLPVPTWAMKQQYTLSEPWYLEARTLQLRKLQEDTTPEIFKRRNILGGDRMLDRV